MVSVKRAKTHLVFLSDSLHALQELVPLATQSLSSIGNQGPVVRKLVSTNPGLNF